MNVFKTAVVAWNRGAGATKAKGSSVARAAALASAGAGLACATLAQGEVIATLGLEERLDLGGRGLGENNAVGSDDFDGHSGFSRHGVAFQVR